MESNLRKSSARSARAFAILLPNLVLTAFAGPEIASWPQFRGPNASGVSDSAHPPVKIGPTENVLWKMEIPWSPSSPSIWGDRIFLTTFHDGQLETRAHDRRTGKPLWSKGVKAEKLEEFHQTDGSPAASTPATDGEHVVSYFGSFGLICHDVEGRELWRHPLPMAKSGGSYGTGTSPIIAGKRVLLNRDQDGGSSLLAVDIETGKRAWEAPRPDMIGSFGTPVMWKNAGVDEVVLGGSVQVKAYHLATGAERWVVNGVSSFVCTTPVVGKDTLFFAAWSPGKADSSFPTEWEAFKSQFDTNKDGKVNAADFDTVRWNFIRGIDTDHDGTITAADLARIKERSSRAENVLVAIRPGGSGDITSTHVAWKFTKGLPYVPSPLYYDGRVYVMKDGGMISSVDATTGKPFYAQERLNTTGGYYASPVAADGRLYLASLPGKLTVAKAGGETPEILHQVDFGERIFATPALVEDKLYLRTQNHLYAFGNGRPD